ELADALRSLDLVRAEVPGLLAAPAAAERSGAAPRTRGPAAAPRPAGADAPAAGAPAPSADRADLPLPRRCGPSSRGRSPPRRAPGTPGGPSSGRSPATRP